MAKGSSSNSSAITFLSISTAIILWGFSFIWTDEIIDTGTPVFTFIFFRMLVAGVLLLLFSLITGKLQKIDKKDWKWLLLLIIFEPFIYFIGETFGLKATDSPTLSAIIVATIPLFTLANGVWFYKEKITWINIIGVVITIPGIALMVLNKGDFTAKYWWGIALLFLAVAGSVGYTTIVKKIAGKYNSYTITTYQFLIGALLFLPCFLIFNDGFPIKTLLSKEIIVPLITLAILCSCLAFVLYVNSIRAIGITRSSIFTSLIPAVSAFGGYLMGRESFSTLQIIGIAIVTAGVIITQKR